MTSLDEEETKVELHIDKFIYGLHTGNKYMRLCYVLQHIPRILAQLRFSTRNINGDCMSLLQFVQICMDCETYIPYNVNLIDLLTEVKSILRCIEFTYITEPMQSPGDYDFKEIIKMKQIRLASSYAILNLRTKFDSNSYLLELLPDQFRVVLSYMSQEQMNNTKWYILERPKYTVYLHGKLKVMYDYNLLDDQISEFQKFVKLSMCEDSSVAFDDLLKSNNVQFSIIVMCNILKYDSLFYFELKKPELKDVYVDILNRINKCSDKDSRHKILNEGCTSINLCDGIVADYVTKWFDMYKRISRR